MPTNLDRIQVLLRPEPFADVRTIAKHERRSMSAMAAELLEAGLQQPKYQAIIKEAEKQGGRFKAKEDPRTMIKQANLTKEEDPKKSAKEQLMEKMLAMFAEMEDK